MAWWAGCPVPGDAAHGAAGRGPPSPWVHVLTWTSAMGRCFPPGRAQPPQADPIKALPGCGSLFLGAMAPTSPPAPSPLHHLPTSPAEISLLHPPPTAAAPASLGGAEMKPAATPHQAGSQTPGGLGTAAPGTPSPCGARPRAAAWERKGWRCWGGNAGEGGRGWACSWCNVFLPCGRPQRGEGTRLGPSPPLEVVPCAAGAPTASPQ